jgi:hypothetical protein
MHAAEDIPNMYSRQVQTHQVEREEQKIAMHAAEELGRTNEMCT